MPNRYGLWLPVANESTAERFENAIERDGKFTAIVSASQIRPKLAELCLISLSGVTADYLCISRAGQLVATNQKRIAVSNLIDLQQLGLVDVETRLPTRYQSRFMLPSREAARISPKMWENILIAIRAARPSVAEQIQELEALVRETLAYRGRRNGGLEVFERDAVASAVQIWGGTSYRKRVLRSASADNADQPAPFLSRLNQVSMREDAQIIHDSAVFPGLEIARRYQVGAVEFENERGERLTILHCNRQPLEQTLGVDLIYYNHVYDSFVLVQYKRMIEEGENGPVYRPSSDSNYEVEVDRMAEVEALLQQAEMTEQNLPIEYRLSTRPFFFKFCETKSKAALDDGMVSGMYVPLDLWNRFIASEDARGARGGLLVSWRSAPRHFNNGSFTNLVRSGWIGSAAGQSQMLSGLISNILDGQRMLILASTSTARSAEDYRRDDLGRFASDDDPLATR